MTTQEPPKKKNRRTRSSADAIQSSGESPLPSGDAAPSAAAGTPDAAPNLARGRRRKAPRPPEPVLPGGLDEDGMLAEVIATQQALMRRLAELAGIWDGGENEEIGLDELLETLRGYSLGGARLAAMLKAQKELQAGAGGGTLAEINRMLAEIVKELEQ